MTIVNVFHRQLYRCTHRFCGITHVVVRFILRFQAIDDLNSFFDRRFSNINFLEATRQSTVFLENVAELLIGCRTNYANFTAGEQRFDQVSRIDLATRGCTRTDNGVDLINKQDAVSVLLQLLEQRFKTFFKVAAIFCAR